MSTESSQGKGKWGQHDNHYATETYGTIQRRFKVLNARPATIFTLKDNVHNKFKKYTARFSYISSDQAISMTLIYNNIVIH